MNVSKEIKRVRLNARMTQTEFGLALGTSVTTINNWEKGHVNISVKYASKLEDVFGVKVDLSEQVDSVSEWDNDIFTTNTNNILTTEVQWYDGNKNSSNKGKVTLKHLVNTIQNPVKKTKELLDKIQKARVDGNESLKNSLKGRLPGFTPCVIVKDKRKVDQIETFTGVAVLDFDKLAKHDVDPTDLKKELFKNDYIFATWVSSSGDGVRALVNIPVCESLSEFKGYIRGLKRELGAEWFDNAISNAVLVMYISMDKDILIRENPTEFDIWVDEPVKKVEPIDPEFIHLLPGSDKIGTEEAKTNIKELLIMLFRQIEIDQDNGHPRVRGYARLMGGYVGAGYMTYEDMEHFMHFLVDNNSYLSQKDYVYKKTISEFIEHGMDEPIIFENN